MLGIRNITISSTRIFLCCRESQLCHMVLGSHIPIVLLLTATRKPYATYSKCLFQNIIYLLWKKWSIWGKNKVYKKHTCIQTNPPLSAHQNLQSEAFTSTRVGQPSGDPAIKRCASKGFTRLIKIQKAHPYSPPSSHLVPQARQK